MPEQSRTALVLVAVLVLVLLPFLWMGMAGGMMGPWMMGGWGGSASPWWGVFSLVFGVLMVAGIGLLAVWAVRHLGPDEGGRGQSALEILKARYARGELSRDQYEQMRRDLE